MGGLSDGGLTFPAPFDPATAAALGDNMDSGQLAERLFDVTAQRDCAYSVMIAALTPTSVEPVRRELINTTVNSTQLLFTLLEGLMDELEARLSGTSTD
jgi:hypothetical protein